MLIEIVRQSLYTRDIQPTSKLRQICEHLRRCYVSTGCVLISKHSLVNFWKKTFDNRLGFRYNIKKRGRFANSRTSFFVIVTRKMQCARTIAFDDH